MVYVPLRGASSLGLGSSAFKLPKIGAGSVGFFAAVISIARWEKYCRAIQYDPDS